MIDKVSFLDQVQIINENIVKYENHKDKCQKFKLESEHTSDAFSVNNCMIHLKQDMSQNVPLSLVFPQNNSTETLSWPPHFQQTLLYQNTKKEEQNTISSINDKDIIESQNESDNKLIENKISHKNFNYQSNQIQDDQYKKIQRLGEKRYFTSIDENSYRLQTLRKDYEEKEQYENIGVIYENDSSMVDLKFDLDLNKFVVTKENKGEKEEFEREYKILQQLKGTNLTLDIISVNQIDYKFQQFAGQTNLYSFNQKTFNDCWLKEYFFILFEKLNKLHEKGIAHSDIKQQNIVISYENEPYFIDFGGSINLSNKNEYQFYLNQYSPSFNLQIYLDKRRQFKNKEEIMLCDKTQLALTFLYLYCNHEKEFQLFQTKNYNQLIQILISQSIHINQNTILSIICRILNDADSNIKKIENQKILKINIHNQQYLKGEFKKFFNIELEKIIFRAYNIDKFSILLIYFLDIQNQKLLINPSKIQISILDDMKEYKYISEKYKINRYFEDLINTNKYLTRNDFFNICEFVKVNQITNLKIKIKQSFFLNFKLIFQKISFLNSIIDLELIIEFFAHGYQLQKLTTELKEQGNWYLHPESFQIVENSIICKIVKNKDSFQNQQSNISVIYYKFSNSFYRYFHIDWFKVIQSNYKIKQYEFLFRLFYNHDYMIYNDPFIYYVKEHVFSYKNLSNFQFERQLQTLQQQHFDYKDLKVKNRISFYDQCQAHKIKCLDDLNDFIKKIYKQQLSNIMCNQCQSIISSIKQDISIQVEQFTCEILKMTKPQFIIKIKIYDYFFESTQMWEEINSIIEINKKNYLELILFNCQFSQKVNEILSKLDDNVRQYEFNNEYDQQNVNDEDFLKFQKFKIKNKIKLGIIRVIKVYHLEQKQIQKIIQQYSFIIYNLFCLQCEFINNQIFDNNYIYF